MNILVTLHKCNSSIFFHYFSSNLLYESTDFFWDLSCTFCMGLRRFFKFCEGLRVEFKWAPCQGKASLPDCMPYVCGLEAGIMHHPVCACREKGQEPVQLHWLERSLGLLWGKLKDACTVYKQQNLVWDSSSGLEGESGIGVAWWWLLLRVPRRVSLNNGQHSWWLFLWSALGFPAADSSSGFWGESASASVAVGIVGSLSPCNMQNL